MCCPYCFHINLICFLKQEEQKRVTDEKEKVAKQREEEEKKRKEREVFIL